MAQIVELELGWWLEGLPDDMGRDVEMLCHLLCDRIADAVVCVGMFEQAQAALISQRDTKEWERDAELHREREAELEADDPHDFRDADYHRWRTAISERARRDVQRMKWAHGDGPKTYQRRLPFIHARSFLHALAQLRRALRAMTEYDLGDKMRNHAVRVAADGLDAAVPGLKGVRDSTEHAEDRVRSRVQKRPLVPGPVMTAAVNAPNGGALIVDMLHGRCFGCTIEDGSYAEVEVSDATVEAARLAVQAVFDVLPWRAGQKRYEPSL